MEQGGSATVPDEQFAAPGSVLVIRDETWLVTRVERATDGWFVDVQGLSELVRDTEATFSTALDDIRPLDPAQAEVVADDSPQYRSSRLWLEDALRNAGEAERTDALQRERSLFYVAATRARDELVVLWRGEHSPFLS